MSPNTPKSLYERFDVAQPPSIIAPGQFGNPLFQYGLLSLNEVAEKGSAQVLAEFIKTFGNNMYSLLTHDPSSVRSANERILRSHLDIDIGEAELVSAILLKNQGVNTAAMLDEVRNPEDLAIIALKLALDYAQGNCPLVRFGEGRHEFIPVIIGNVDAEMMIGRMLEILLDLQEKSGVDTSEHVALLEQLAPHIWRSTVIRGLENARRNMPLVRTGLPIVARGTDTPITESTELRAVANFIRQARRRIGDAVQDLESQLFELKRR